MARISGVNLPNNKRVVIALTYIYGIGKTKSEKLLDKLKIDHNIQAKDLTDAQVGQLRDLIEKSVKVEGDLKREVLMNIKRLKEITSYRGIRHERNLPLRGQRTKTNSRTVRGNKRGTGASGKVKLTKT